ncbi:CrcB family protein [Cohnella sp. WQ 127256]|uniref:fluoride efflux transporter FluC n=1 Tax=Cohnella sp. WQ 127256 TaxID=2938790 RepID=UPI00211942E9|nr:CrcB family protein [Cohnella sp. WQ 127256]
MNSLWIACLVGIGGAIGSLIRYEVGRWVVRKMKMSYIGTLLVNLVGSFAMGLLIGINLEQEHFAVYACCGIGILGGLTTYSTLNVQKALMNESNSRHTLAYYLLATYVGGFSLTAAGVGFGYLIHT